MKNKLAVITGATGFIGGRLVAELAANRWRIVCAVRKPVKTLLPDITIQTVDLEQPSSVEGLFSSTGPVDAVFHLGAAIPSPRYAAYTDMDYIRVNAIGTAALLQAAVKAHVRSFVYASSITVNGKPTQVPIREDHTLKPLNSYSLSKLFGEQYCEMIRNQSPSTDITCLRITSPYGSGMPVQSVLPRFVAKVLANEDIQWMGTGLRTQNFVHVQDLAQIFIKAADASKPGVYNAAGVVCISMRDLAELVIQSTAGTTSKASPSGQPDPQDDYRWEIDITRAKEKLGYSPAVLFEQGLKEYIASVREKKEPATWWRPL